MTLEEITELKRIRYTTSHPIDMTNDLIYLKGSIPGSKNSLVFLKNSIKNINKKTIVEKNNEIERKTPNKVYLKNCLRYQYVSSFKNTK